MTVDLIIDGYNLLHYAGLGNVRRQRGKFEQARDQLLKRLKESLTPEELSHTTIVFDAQFAEHADRRPTVVSGMTVVFSPLGRQADDLIEDILCAARQPQQLRVVSSDHRLRLAARAARAAHVDSDTFLVELDDRCEKQERIAQQSNIPAPSKHSPSQTNMAEDWLKEFGEIDMAALDQELRAEELRKRPPTPANAPKTKPLNVKPVRSVPSEPPVTPLEPTPQMTRRVVPGRPDSKPSPLATGSQPDMVDSAELSFWEQRIAEALQEDSTPRPRKPGSNP